MLALNDGRSELYQWDTRRTVSVDADCSQVHFSNKVFGRSIDVDVVDGIAIIPDILLQTDKDFTAWAFIGTAENGYTKISKVFKVNKRNKPADYVFTPPEQTTLEEIKEKLDYLESIQDPDAIKNAVDEYLANNPIQIDEKDPTVPDWAKQTTKPKYTATEVGAVAKVNGVKPDANGNVEITIPDSGGNVDQIEPMEDDIPKVFFGAALPQTKDDTVMSFRYISKTKDIRGYCKTKAQGSSSMQFPKKNQTTKLYKDAECTEELKVDFKGWGEQNKFCFKANWIDHSHARNIIGARLWDMVVSNRSDYGTLPVKMRNSPNNGAINGFPVKLYAEGVYQGIYTLNIPKDTWMWNMDETNANHVLLCAEVNNNGEDVDTSCNFRTLWGYDNAWEWEVEVGERTETIASSFNALISCVKDTDDETFKNTIGNHLDIQSAIDYWIHQYVICNMDGLGKNLLMATYDGVKWICGSYDMDSTFGLYIDGSKFASTQYRCPEDYQETRSLLWERISTLFADEVKARYAELRDKVYSYANLFNHFERFMDVIGSDLYAEDLTVFPDIPSASGNNIRQIRTFMKERLYYTDIQFGLIAEPEPEKTIIATNYIQSASDTATTFELYNGAVDWNTQGLAIELAVEHTNQDGNMFFIGENLNSHDDDFVFKTWYWDNAQYMDVYIQSSNVNGEWNQCNVSRVSDYITDWSNIQIEVNKNGIFVNGNDIAGKAKAPDVYALLFERLMSKTTLQIGKKNADKLHPATFKSVYFYNLGIE